MIIQIFDSYLTWIIVRKRSLFLFFLNLLFLDLILGLMDDHVRGHLFFCSFLHDFFNLFHDLFLLFSVL